MSEAHPMKTPLIISTLLLVGCGKDVPISVKQKDILPDIVGSEISNSTLGTVRNEIGLSLTNIFLKMPKTNSGMWFEDGGGRWEVRSRTTDVEYRRAHHGYDNRATNIVFVIWNEPIITHLNGSNEWHITFKP